MQKKQISPLVADALLLVVTIIWGATFVTVKESVTAYPPNSFLAIRFAVAALALALFGNWRAWLHPGVLKVGAMAGVWLAAGYILQTLGLMHTTPAKAGFITGLSVIMVPIIVAVLDRRWPSPAVLSGALLSLLGLALLSLGQDFSLDKGDLLVFLAAIGFAAQIVVVGRNAKDLDALPLTGVQLVTVALLTGLLALGEQRPDVFPIVTMWGLLFTALPATAFVFFIQARVQRFTSASRTALIFSAEPVFAAFFSWLLIGEVFGMRDYIGCGLILGGILLAELMTHKQTSSMQA